MILSNNTKRAFVFVTIFTFSFMFFGCDYVKERQTKTDKTPLKGKKITAEYLQKYSSVTAKSDCCTGKYSSFEVYSINTNSPKAKEIENRIISDLKSFSDKDANKMSSIDDPEQFPDPNLDDGVIMVNPETGQERLAIPLDNGSDVIHEYSYAEYDSNIDAVISQLFYYKAETTYSKSELEANPDLAEQTTADIEIKDQNGQVLFSHVYNSSSVNKVNYNGNSTSDGCFGDCINEVREGMDWFTWLMCMAGGPICAIGFTLYCTAYCIF